MLAVYKAIYVLQVYNQETRMRVINHGGDHIARRSDCKHAKQRKINVILAKISLEQATKW